ncbi:MAG: alpha/beta hydrolase-fold protein [Ramlibacter sp.]
MIRDTRRALWSVLLAFSTALAACGGGGDSAPTPSPTPVEPVGQVVQSTLASAENGFTYTLQVYLPASYPTGTTTLPVIYATEGDAPFGVGSSGATGGSVRSRFETLKEAMQRRGTQAILVGISGTARRDVDFLLPGAAKYVSFIARELAPSIERQYRADPKRRALSGLSHGGYFVVAALVLEGTAGPLSFSHYLSTESSFGGHPNVAAYLDFEKQLAGTGKPMPATLFLAGANTSNGPVVVNPLYEQMVSQKIPGLTLLKSDYPTTHVGADVPAFEEALARFFP